LFFPKKTTSISQLECYFSCPYKFFANYGLGIKEREESRLKSIDFGNVLHRIAELYVKDIEAKELLLDKAIEAVGQPQLLKNLSKNIAELAFTDSANVIAKEVIKLAKKYKEEHGC
jgi:ATP-dependent helicase/DNAse subunit B